MSAEATRAYYAATEAGDAPFDHQRDAYEQGWEDGNFAEFVRITGWLRNRGYGFVAQELVQAL